MKKARAAVLVPGARGGQATPWMSYSHVAVEQRDAQVHPITWEPPSSLYSRPDTAVDWVREHVERELDAVDSQASTLIIGKSLGSNAAVIAAERQLPAIWLTPLLMAQPLVAALRQASAPFLLIGGTNDPAWDGELAADLTPHVCEIVGANHGFFRSGQPLARSAEALGEMGTAIERFLDETVWPA